jgi:hypothetical protein
MFIYLLAVFLFLFEVTFTQNLQAVLPKYNFNGQQRYEIDMEYNSLPGTNLYAFSEDNTTLFIIDIIPKKTLIMNFKVYTNDTLLIQRAKNSSLFVGFDFNTEHTPPNKKTDIVLCNFTAFDATCWDYLYYTDSLVLMPNTPGFENKLVPLGISNYTSRVTFTDVRYYDAYFGLTIAKDYGPGFDSDKFYHYMLEAAPNGNFTVFGFYGMWETNRIIDSEVYRNYTLVMSDGFGLDVSGSYFFNVKLLYLIILTLFVL